MFIFSTQVSENCERMEGSNAILMHVRFSVCVILDSMHACVCSFHTKDNACSGMTDLAIAFQIIFCLNGNGIDLIKTAI